MRQLPLGVRLRDRAVFASFHPGPNAEAVRLLQVVAAEGRGTLWLHGPPGCGKSHLLQATCAASPASSRIAYLPIGEILEAGAASVDDWQGFDGLCVDDVDRVGGRPEWDAALFGLYRDADERRAALVVAAEVPPSAVAWSLPDLASRFDASIVLRLQPLSGADGFAALRLRARLRGVELPEETVRWLERRHPRDLLSLFGLLDRLDDAALTAQRRLTVPFVRDVLAAPPDAERR